MKAKENEIEVYLGRWFDVSSGHTCVTRLGPFLMSRITDSIASCDGARFIQRNIPLSPCTVTGAPAIIYNSGMSNEITTSKMRRQRQQ
jgi:hypothetical protein